MEENQKSKNKMGVMPVGKLLANMAIPMVISMLVQAMYNVVDSYFVAKISTDALTAISLAYPIHVDDRCCDRNIRRHELIYVAQTRRGKH